MSDTNGKNGTMTGILKVEQRPTSEITPYGKNPRKNDQAVASVAESIKQFGFRQPIVVDTESVIVCGHTRWKAACKLGLESVPVHVADNLTPAQIKAYRIADNKTGELAQWDLPMLADELGPLQDEVDWLSLGFDQGELDGLLGPAEGLTDPDEVPEPPVEPVTKTGDLWLLGEHRVLCGDSSDAEQVRQFLGSEHVSSCLTDPPYGIGLRYDQHDDTRAKWFGLMDKVVPIIRNVSPFCIMPCCGIDRMAWWYTNHRPDWLIAWYKGSPGHRSPVGFNDWEAHLVWGKPQDQMHDYFQTRCGFEVAGHPCPKPVAWASWLLERMSRNGQLIFDPFIGSGTTLIAAEQLNRKCYGIEISPAYCDVIVARWEEFTGKTAKLDS